MPLTQEDYVSHDGDLCPFCSSRNLLRISSVHPETYTSEVECHDCGKIWFETFGLTGYITSETYNTPQDDTVTRYIHRSEDEND